MRKAEDLSGERFGRLTVVSRNTARSKRVYWNCHCDCGNFCCAEAGNLKSSQVTSCGCFRSEQSRERATGRSPGNTGRYMRAPSDSGFNRLWASYKQSAIKRGYTWDVTREMFRKLTSSPCIYCGSPPSRLSCIKSKTMTSYASERSRYLCNGVDRVDNTKGYTDGNVVPCCTTCNSAKSVLTLSEFFAWVDRLISKRLTTRDGDWHNHEVTVGVRVEF